MSSSSTYSACTSIEVLLSQPLDVASRGAAFARLKARLPRELCNKAVLGKCIALDVNLISVDIMMPEQVDAAHAKLQELGSVRRVASDSRKRRLDRDAQHRSEMERRQRGCLASTETAQVMATLARLWGEEGTAAKRARRADQLLQLFASSQRLADSARLRQAPTGDEQVDSE